MAVQESLKKVECCSMKKIFLLISLLFGFLFICQTPIKADSTAGKQEYINGKISQIVDETRLPGDSADQFFYIQKIKVERSDTHEMVDIQAGTDMQPLSETQRYTKGTSIILVKQVDASGKSQYAIADTYRIPAMFWLLVGFLLLVLLTARKKGISAIIGMFMSLAVLMYYIVPHIIQGENPVLIALIGSVAVSIITVYMCHGWSLESHLAIVSMMLSLVAVGLLSYAAVHAAHLAGLGSEDASYLQFGSTAKINLQGLLLGGMMIGALGVLDDITLAQISVIHQLHDAKPEMDFAELYRRGLEVGKDHVASLVNTLILAYAAGSLPLFLLFTINTTQPSWVTLNSEIIAEEVVRTLTGSIGLVLAVPIATFIASYFMIWRKPPAIPNGHQVLAHHH